MTISFFTKDFVISHGLNLKDFVHKPNFIVGTLGPLG